MTVLDHPRRTQRITAAQDNLITAIAKYRLQRVVRQLAYNEWNELLTAAMACEFEHPGSGMEVLRNAQWRRKRRRKNAAA